MKKLRSADTLEVKRFQTLSKPLQTGELLLNGPSTGSGQFTSGSPVRRARVNHFPFKRNENVGSQNDDQCEVN